MVHLSDTHLQLCSVKDSVRSPFHMLCSGLDPERFGSMQHSTLKLTASNYFLINFRHPYLWQGHWLF